jgi:hypothetical protein
MPSAAARLQLRQERNLCSQTIPLKPQPRRGDIFRSFLDDAAPERSWNVLSSQNYKYAAPTALDALNPSEVLFLGVNPFHIRQILFATGGQFVSHKQKFNPLGV